MLSSSSNFFSHPLRYSNLNNFRTLLAFHLSDDARATPTDHATASAPVITTDVLHAANAMQPPKEARLLAPAATRSLFFSEIRGDDREEFYLTLAGATPKKYNPFDAPDITAVQGTMEDWVIENHSQEDHVFHIHQIHFIVIERNNITVPDSQVYLSNTGDE